MDIHCRWRGDQVGRGVRSQEILCRPSEYAIRPYEYVSQPSEYASRPPEYASRLYEHVIRLPEHASRLPEYISRPFSHIFRPETVRRQPYRNISRPCEVFTWSCCNLLRLYSDLLPSKVPPNRPSPHGTCSFSDTFK